MTWDESEHPRDELGRFTFKEGEEENKEKDRPVFKLHAEYNDNNSSDRTNKGSASERHSQNPADILYKKTKLDIENNKKRNELLKKFGEKFSPKEIFYSTKDELESKLKESFRKNIWFQKRTEDFIGKNYGKFSHELTKRFAGPDTGGMLDISHGDNMNDKEYIKDAIELKNYDDPRIESDKNYLEEKIYEQFKDYGFNKEDIKGYFFKNSSEPSKRIAQNNDFKNILKQNKKAILNNENFSGRFQSHGSGFFGDNNFKNAFGGFDVRHPYFDKQGNLHLKIYDTYDFNKIADDFLNKAGRNEMEKGNLNPYFSIHDIIIPKQEINEILK